MWTEEEAKKRWCPEARVLFEIDLLNAATSTEHVSLTAINRTVKTAKVPENSLCMGGACMAWRWAKHDEGRDMPTGYCGKAGKP